MNSKIKILQIGMTPNLGGVEAYIMNMYRKINRQNVQFDFINWYEDQDLAYSEEIRELGGKVFNIKSRSKNIVSNYVDLNSIIRNGDYQYVYYNVNSLSDITGMRSVLELPGTQLIVHAHNDSIGQNQLVTKALHKLHKSFMKKDIFRFACSQNAGKWMFGENEFTIIPDAIDVEQFKFDIDQRNICRKYLKLGLKTVYGCIARFSPQKNHKFLIDIFAEIHKRDTNTFLLLVGEGYLKTEIQQKINKLNLADSVMFLGMRNDINFLLQAIDVMIAPSVYEGFGISVLEAQCAGVCCYVSDIFNDEIMQTPIIMKIGLHKSAEEWAIQIINNQAKLNYCERKAYSLEIKNKGYDINSIALNMEKVFLNNVRSKN